MKVALLSSWLSKKGGGVSEVVLRLAHNLRIQSGMEVEAFGLRDSEIEKDLLNWQPIKVNVLQTKGREFFGYAPGLISAMINSHCQLLHLHGIWQYPSLACYQSGLPYMTTVHGMLDEWAIKNSGLKKKIASLLYEKAA